MLQNRSRILAIIISISCGISLASSAQDKIKKYVSIEAVQIATIEPKDTNYSDLEFVGKAIGESKIVMLGEQDHGDAAAFLAKTRLIKYLHQEKGFNVLAFEGEFFGLNQDWGNGKDGNGDWNAFIRANLSPFWTNCDALSSLLYNYLPQSLHTNSPIVLTGFDNHMNTRKFIPKFDSVLRSLQLPIAQTKAYGETIFPLISAHYKSYSDSRLNKQLIEYLLLIKSQMTQKLKEDDFWIKAVENFIQLNRSYPGRTKNYWKEMNERDLQMAINLKWLSEVKYPDKKIIVWAHNYHISKYEDTIRISF